MKGISIYEEDIESRRWQAKEMMPCTCILTALGRN